MLRGWWARMGIRWRGRCVPARVCFVVLCASGFGMAIYRVLSCQFMHICGQKTYQGLI
jgi:hypothetical protein